jgi:hypothetical protein
MGDNNKNYIVSGATLNDIGNAIISKGGASSGLTVAAMPQAIRNISTSVNTKTLDIGSQQHYVNDNTGNISGDIYLGAYPYDGTSGYVYVGPSGMTLDASPVHITSNNLKPGNIKSGVKVMGVTGTYSGTYNGPYTYLGTLTSSGYYDSIGIMKTSNPHMIIFNSALPLVRLYHGGTGRSIYGGVSGNKTILVYSGEEPMTNLYSDGGETGYVYSI